MGSIQRMATVVVVSLVALSTILFLYLGDEDNRIQTEAAAQQEVAIERARTEFISLCLSCHGPAGEGFTEPGAAGTGRVGAPLGGINTSLNQQGINSRGTPIPGGVEGREKIIRETIENGLKNPDGSYRMPPFSEVNGGPLNDEQVNEMVIMIQNGDWNETFNEAVETSGGYPTPPPAPGADATQTAQAEAAAEPASEGESEAASSSEAAQEVTVDMYDIYFDPSEFTIPANTPVKVVLPNLGAAVHDFSIDELNISVTVEPGETGETVINAPAGTYEYYCNIPGHKDAGMVGTLTIEEGAATTDTGGDTTAAATDSADSAATDEGQAATAAEDVTVELHDIFFDPSDVTIPANTPVKVNLPNLGAAQHDFSIDELGIAVVVDPGDTGEVTIDAPAGVYDVYCSIPGHKDAGMVGTLTVVEGSAATADASGDSAAVPASDEATDASGDDSASIAAADDVTVELHDIYFEPADFTIPANTPVKVILPNLGAAQHDFSIDALDVAVVVDPGDTGEVTIDAPAGEYDFYCSIPGHKDAGMVGKLTIE